MRHLSNPIFPSHSPSGNTFSTPFLATQDKILALLDDFEASSGVVELSHHITGLTQAIQTMIDTTSYTYGDYPERLMIPQEELKSVFEEKILSNPSMRVHYDAMSEKYRSVIQQYLKLGRTFPQGSIFFSQSGERDQFYLKRALAHPIGPFGFTVLGAQGGKADKSDRVRTIFFSSDRKSPPSERLFTLFSIGDFGILGTTYFIKRSGRALRMTIPTVLLSSLFFSLYSSPFSL